MKNILVLSLSLIILICTGCSKKEDGMSEDMNHEGHMMDMDEDKGNE